MDLYLKEKVALVTGGGQGIGREICLSFAKEGAFVGINDIDLKRANLVEKEILSLGSKAIALRGDVTRWEEVDEMVKKLIGKFGRIDILVNNAGVGDQGKLFMEMERKDWDRVIGICLYGALNCNRAVLPNMIERKMGKIVSITSDAGRVGEARMSVYSAAKAAIIGHSKALAKEVGIYGININVVSPGSTETETTLGKRRGLSEKLGEKRAAERLKKQLSLYPLRRFGQPIDIGNAVLFLSSDVSSYITGEVLSVSGGYTMVS
jgi:NAD(P)-dependent dehydrogenase (short-subunit alcohol dehydrogenase family)